MQVVIGDQVPKLDDHLPREEPFLCPFSGVCQSAHIRPPCGTQSIQDAAFSTINAWAMVPNRCAPTHHRRLRLKTANRRGPRVL